MNVEFKSYYNPDDECWWAYAVDAEGNQIGDAEPAPSKGLAIKYAKLFLASYMEENAKKPEG
jgi:hypothetical protein